MSRSEAINGVINAIKLSAKHSEWGSGLGDEMTQRMLRHIEADIERVTDTLYADHADVIELIVAKTVKARPPTEMADDDPLPGAKPKAKGRATASVNASASTTATEKYYRQIMKALYSAQTPAAFDAMVCLGHLMALWQMRCTYRIVLSKDLVYSDDV